MLNLEVSQVIIQIIAFLIMLWVMKRFGWTPLLTVLETRRKNIQTEFASIAAEKEEAKKVANQYEERLKNIHLDARKKIQEAIAEGNRISLEIQQDAQARAKEILEQARVEIAQEMSEAKVKLKNEIVNLIVITTEKVLQETLDDKAHQKLIADFVKESSFT